MEMDFSRLFKDAQKHPDAYGLNRRYREFVAFVNGCNSATAGHLLDGFPEHLAERLGSGGNLYWALLVAKLGVSPGEIRRVDDTSGEVEKQIVSCLFAELLKFFESRDSGDVAVN
ncbi:hypothetical protein [Streptomyces prunicolor]|uniref:Uncharacterized protein n=1 Tax=Streptomyces prunicolor TaxID=67348 RepID=A0ABU4FJK0_9ACTN|nr:hypothetical protein [Streptomyces prunicolor]MDV7220178.1 hypothetical protein [Streptomyces prunicolor]